MKKHNNPLLKKAYREGVEFGIKHGVNTAIDDFIKRVDSLVEVDGIGDKTLKKIHDHLNIKERG